MLNWLRRLRRADEPDDGEVVLARVGSPIP